MLVPASAPDRTFGLPPGVDPSSSWRLIRTFSGARELGGPGWTDIEGVTGGSGSRVRNYGDVEPRLSPYLPGFRLPALVPRGAGEGRTRRQRPSAGDDGHPPLRLLDLG